MKQIRLYVAFLLFMIFQVGFGQIDKRINVSGQVSDTVSNTPVKATVMFMSYPDGSNVYVGECEDSTGTFNIFLHQEYKYVIEVTAPNYKPEIDTFYVSSDTNTLNYQLISVKKGSLLRLHNIYFDQGDYKILENSYQELGELILLLDQYPDMIIQLEGHTDRLGGSAANMKLSENRVLAIKEYLVGQGIFPKRIKTKAFGETQPVSTENTEESRQLNRRVEVRILEI